MFAPPALIAVMSKTAAIFLGTVWITVMAFALKVADVTESPALTADEHASMEDLARSAVRRIWIYAGVNAVMTVVALLPSVMVDAKLELSALTTICAGGAVGFVVHSIVMHAWWQEEIRRFRSSLRAREREEKRVDALRKKMEESSGLPLTDKVRAEIESHNKAIDWPTNSGPH